MRNALFNWGVVVPMGSVQTDTQTWNYDATSITMTFKIAPADLLKCIRHVVGYTRVYTQNNAKFLNRNPPASHPDYPNLHATKILNIKGVGTKGNKTNLVGTNLLQIKTGTWDSWEVYHVTVQFESLNYDVRPDKLTQGEYQRYVVKRWEPSLETIARKGTPWYLNGTGASPVPRFPGDIFQKTPKGIMEWTWIGVPEDFIMNGRILPGNIQRGLGKVNEKLFPQYFDPNGDPDDPPQFPAGTLLAHEPKLIPRQQSHAAACYDGGAIGDFIFWNFATLFDVPRTYDVVFRLEWFDPYTPDWAPPILVNVRGNVGNQVTPRGHQLVPSPKPIGGIDWFPATNIEPINPITSDSNLLYRYYDFNKFFQYSPTFG